MQKENNGLSKEALHAKNSKEYGAVTAEHVDIVEKQYLSQDSAPQIQEGSTTLLREQMAESMKLSTSSSVVGVVTPSKKIGWTPEPWEHAISKTWPHGRPDLATSALNIHGGQGQKGFDGNIVAVVAPYPHITEQDVANADRIVACVNACAGIKDPVATLQGVRAALKFVIHHHNTDCETCMDKINEAYLSLK